MSFKILELFSGIGGMHYALEAIDITKVAEVVTAIDISEVPNSVYRHNFSGTVHLQRNICGLTAKDLDRLGVNVILMSPPCQPYTRQGLQRDAEDARAQPLLHLVDLLSTKVEGLKYVLLENVKGFERSECRDRLVRVLGDVGFVYQEFLISPTHLGVPNSRLRYYLIARRVDDPFPFQTKPDLWTELGELKHLVKMPEVSERTLKGYLENNAAEEMVGYDVSAETLLKHAEVLDIVESDSDHSCCFTKAYGRYAEGTGSVLQQGGNLSKAYEEYRLANCEEDKLSALASLKLRYFTPREISRLMGFPKDFDFPEETTLRQRYRVLGNSLNVTVVSFLLRLLLT